jgi:hypothetical protein
MIRTVVGAVIGALLGATLGLVVYRVLGALEILRVPNSVSVRPMDFTGVLVHLAMLVGGASGGIVGALVGAVGAIVQALERNGPVAEPFSPYVGPEKQRL